jgi:hypothetical protein
MNDLPILGYRCWKVGLETAPSGRITTRLHDEQEIEGFRVIGAPYLTSYYSGVQLGAAHRWRRISNAVTTTRCRKSEVHQAAAVDCSCGLYAYHDLATAVHELRTYYAARHHQPWAPEYLLGAVVGTGRILIHKQGWRASRARIVAFSDIGPAFSDWPQFHGPQLATELGVPVVHHRHLARYALEHGRRIDKADLGENREARLAA